MVVQVGRLPDLSIAEITTRCPAWRVMGTIREEYISFVAPQEPIESLWTLQQQIGGTQRIMELIGIDESMSEALMRSVEHIVDSYESGKLHLSVLIAPHPGRLNEKILVRLKEALKAQGVSVRILNRQGKYLDPGSLLKEGFGRKQVREICLIQDQKTKHWHLAETRTVTNPTAYADRDHHKPGRDAHVGMLPPKLAQMMVNLTSLDGLLPQRLCDPFCGTGTVLLEAALMGIHATGRDLESRLIDLSRVNVEHFRLSELIELDVADATKYRPAYQEPYVIATEGWLGPVFYAQPNWPQIRDAGEAVEGVMLPFLERLRRDKHLTRVVLTLPRWRTGKGGADYRCKKLLAHLQEFWHYPQALGITAEDPLIYSRDDQYVIREVHVLEPKTDPW